MELQVKPLAMAVMVMSAVSTFAIPNAVADHHGAMVKKGKEIAEDRKKGNCFACHQYAGAVLPGNIGPPLVAMKARFPDKAKLRAQIYDATAKNPHTSMPPFGKYGALTDEEVDAITEWAYTL
ncbi:MAG TPA: sulfur oxidation c-type cytochrome SoxX [Gammaproteobacteria bacterium]